MPRILIIEDDDAARSLLRTVLESAGYEVVEAPDGKTGIESFRKSPADLVITDLFMPGGDGTELIMELKRDFPDVKIIAVSGGGGRGMKVDMLAVASELGVLGVLKKPYDVREIIKIVRQALGG